MSKSILTPLPTDEELQAALDRRIAELEALRDDDEWRRSPYTSSTQRYKAAMKRKARFRTTVTQALNGAGMNVGTDGPTPEQQTVTVAVLDWLAAREKATFASPLRHSIDTIRKALESRDG